SGTRISSARMIRRARMLSRGFGPVAARFGDVTVLGMLFPNPIRRLPGRGEGGFRGVAKIGTICCIFTCPVGKKAGFRRRNAVEPRRVQTLLTDRAAALAAVRQEMAEACREAGRDPASITLVAISKTFAAEAILPVITAGQRVFGENRVQEAKAKWP